MHQTCALFIMVLILVADSRRPAQQEDRPQLSAKLIIKPESPRSWTEHLRLRKVKPRMLPSRCQLGREDESIYSRILGGYHQDASLRGIGAKLSTFVPRHRQ